MASKREMSEAVVSGASTGDGRQQTPAAKRGRGRPRGSKNRKTLEREAAARAATAGREAGPRAAREGAADAAMPDAALRDPRTWKEGEGRIMPTPVSDESKPLDDDLPVHQFVVPLGHDGRFRLALPVQFELIFGKYIHGSATVREASPRQRSWSVKVEWDGDGRLVLAGGWRAFVLHYRIHPETILLFRYCEGTSDFVVRIFTMGCRVTHPPALSE